MIVLDTHVLIWLASDPEKLSQKAQKAINYADILGICPISYWEIATKVTKKKLILDREVTTWIKQTLALPRIEALNLGTEIATKAGLLSREDFPGDPADRMIVATAQVNGAELVTKDKIIRSFSGVRTIW